MNTQTYGNNKKKRPTTPKPPALPPKKPRTIPTRTTRPSPTTSTYATGLNNKKRK